MLTVFGIKQCDKVRAALKWLDQHNEAYRFVDVRADGLDRETIARWLTQCEATQLINSRSTTWKALTEAARQQVATDAAGLIHEHPTLLKRPLVIADGHCFPGCSTSQLAQLTGR